MLKSWAHKATVPGVFLEHSFKAAVSLIPFIDILKILLTTILLLKFLTY